MKDVTALESKRQFPQFTTIFGLMIFTRMFTFFINCWNTGIPRSPHAHPAFVEHACALTKVEHVCLKVWTSLCQDHVDLLKHSFKTGMKLEMVSPWEQLQICPVSVTKVSHTETMFLSKRRESRLHPQAFCCCFY